MKTPQRLRYHYYNIEPYIETSIHHSQKLRETISIATSLRRQHFHKLDIALELDGKYPKGKSIRQLRAIEQMKKTHASIGLYMKPNQKSVLKHIKVPKDFNNWNNIPKS